MVAPRIPPRMTRRKRAKNSYGTTCVVFVPLLLACATIVWNVIRLFHSLQSQQEIQRTFYPKRNGQAVPTSWNYDWCQKPCKYFLPIDLQDYLPPDPGASLLETIPDPREVNDLFELDESSDSKKGFKDNKSNPRILTDDLDNHRDHFGNFILNPAQTIIFPPTPKILQEIRYNISKHNRIPKNNNDNNAAHTECGDCFAVLSRRGLGDVHFYNQDRSVLIDPFVIQENKPQQPPQQRQQPKQQTLSATMSNNFFMGIWDGHGFLGHMKADFTAKKLPQLLLANLSKFIHKQVSFAQVRKAFQDSFWDAHRQGPLVHDSGCTSSVVLRLDQTLYFANAGDSRCMLIHAEPSGVVNITHITKQHKPNDPIECQRITASGCVVIDPIPFHDSSARVVESLDGTGLALAMSRSLGDYDFEHCGVIPEPTVTSVDLYTYDKQSQVVLLAACVTDGVFDYVGLYEIAKGLANPFVRKDTRGHMEEVSTLESAVEDLIRLASDRWLNNTSFMPYRDDITIAVRRIQ